MNPSKTLKQIRNGSLNVRFRDLQALAVSMGFELVRVSGSHHIYRHPRMRELLNLQDVRGEGKPYQVRQLMRLVERYRLDVEEPS